MRKNTRNTYMCDFVGECSQSRWRASSFSTYGVAVLMNVLPSFLKSGACEGYVVVKNFEIIGVKLRAWVLKALCRKGSLWKHAKRAGEDYASRFDRGMFNLIAALFVKASTL